MNADQPRCGAKTKSGAPCRAAAMRPSGRCRIHGGLTPTGVALPQTVHGRYSKHLPRALAQAVAEVRNDPELLNLSDEIALLHGRVAQLLARLGTGEAGRHWRRLHQTWAAVEAATRSGDAAAFREAAESHRGAIQAGRVDSGVWEDLDRALDRLAKLTRQETDRRLKAGDAIPRAVFEAAFRGLIWAVKAHVVDAQTLANIQRDMQTAIREAEARAKGRET